MFDTRTPGAIFESMTALNDRFNNWLMDDWIRQRPEDELLIDRTLAGLGSLSLSVCTVGSGLELLDSITNDNRPGMIIFSTTTLVLGAATEKIHRFFKRSTEMLQNGHLQ